MSVPKLFDDVIQYFTGAIYRIFGPNDDAYPNTGVQPYSGEPNKDRHLKD
jgi:hypothetical protein